MPERIQLSRRKGWRKPAGVVTVARPTRWGNPAVVEKQSGDRPWAVFASDAGPFIGRYATSAEARARAVEFFEGWLMSRDGSELTWEGISHANVPAFDRIHAGEGIAALRGRDLACWCPPDEPCHADVLLTLANAPLPSSAGAERSEP